MELLHNMGHALVNLFSYSWDYLVSLFGFNILSILLFSAIIPILNFAITFVHRLCRESEKWRVEWKTVVRLLKDAFFSPRNIILGSIYLLAIFGVLSWGITYTVYRDHENLKARIVSLTRERDKYKKTLAGYKEKPQREVKDVKKENDIKQLHMTATKLIDDITHFLSQSSLYTTPPLPSTGQPEIDRKMDWERFQQNVTATKLRDSEFLNRFHQRIIDVAYKYHELGIISDQELQHLLWISQPGNLVIEWTLDALEKYNARIKS
jgi:hypothetical protein